MKKITNLILLMMFMSSMVLMAQTSVNSTISNEEAQMIPQRSQLSPNAQTAAIPQNKLNAVGGATFTVPASGSRAVSNIKIELSVDYWASEATYNVWSYDDGAYLWATNQGFTTGYETITHILALTEGSSYDVDCFDSYGDGGIAGLVSNDDTGWFIMDWASNDYGSYGSFNFTAYPGVPAVPNVTLNPTNLDLGNWPIGGWQEGSTIELASNGDIAAVITGSELADLDGVFGLNNIAIPTTIEVGATAEVGISFTGTGVAEGTYTSQYVASWGDGRGVSVADITVNAYTPIEGDIIEYPTASTYGPGMSSTISSSSSREFVGYYKNYILPNDIGESSDDFDVVTLLNITSDLLMTISRTSGTTTNFALYANDFSGEAGPMASNALVQDFTDIVDFPLFEGSYYLVASSHGDFTGDITTTLMTAPMAAVYDAPFNGEVNVVDGTTLDWHYADGNTMEYQVLLGTSYPPSNVVQDWTVANATNDTYELTGLLPNQQYFWTVNVQNNVGQTDGAIWGFTTTLSRPMDVVAADYELFEGDAVELSWSAPADRSFVGYNVYRDGVQINTATVTGTSYSDNDAVALIYNMTTGYVYNVTAVYTEGESAFSDDSDPVFFSGNGTVAGNVSDVFTTLAIFDATVDFTGTDEFGDAVNFSTTTDAAGNYSQAVKAGDYVVRASAAGYNSDQSDEIVTYGATTTVDFILYETPYPVESVTATELNENSVLVNWSGQGGGTAEWLFYDDGINVDAIGGPATFSWAIKFDPSQLAPFDGVSLTKIRIYNKTSATNTLQIYEGTDAATLLFEQDLIGLDVEAWNVVELTSAIPVDVTKELWVTVYTEDGASYPAACGDAMGEPNGDLITLDGTTWDHLTGYGLMYTWNMGCYVTDEAGRTVELVKIKNQKEYKDATGLVLEATGVENTSPNANLPKYADMNTRSLVGFNIYRGPCGGEVGDMEFKGFTLDEQFTDNTWGAVEPGVYTWAVEAVYDANASEFVYSNCLDNDMITEVTVEVTTNSADSPAGTNVTFFNVDEAFIYEVELDETGVYTWPEFRKGTYDIYVHLNGYADVIIEGESIWEATTFEFILEEMLAPAADLYVTPLGFATWRAGGIVPFEPYFFDFEEGPQDWAIQGNVDGWQWGNSASLSSTFMSFDGNATNFLAVNADAAGSGGSSIDVFNMSPELILSSADEVFVNFDYILVFDNMSIYYSIGDEDPVLVEELVQSSSWTNYTIQLPAEAIEANTHILFHFLENGTWGYGGAIDNVAITDGSERFADRDLDYYKVWLDGIFVTNTDTTFYQYGDNGEELVSGTTYLAEVAAVYSTGISEKAFYEFTYYTCDNFAGPEVFIGENVVGTQDALLTWSNVLPLQEVFITQNPGAPANGYFQSYGSGYGVIYDLSAYPDALASSIEFQHASWGVSGPFDYNIHIINFDTQEYIATLGPFITTGDDIWEENIDLGDVNLNGAVNVGFLMEPLSNDPADAYPDLSSDSDADPQGSVFGPLDDIGAIGSSEIGNFLMNIYIMTANGDRVMAPRVLNLPVAMDATPRVGINHVVANAIIDNQTSDRSRSDVFVGASLYRDGLLLAEGLVSPDTSYLDENLEAGTYNYCINYVYESGAYSCDDCVEVFIGEDCDAPQDLTATVDVVGTDSFVNLLWDQNSVAEWIFYDDGVNVDGIGGPATFIWAIKFDPDQLTELEGGALTKISLYARTAPVNTLQIFEGPNGGTLLFEQDLIGLDIEAWNEVELTSPVEIDVTKEFWIGVNTTDGANYPAACGVATGFPNGDLISQDGGASWEHLTDFGLMDTWNLRGFVTDAYGREVELAPVVNNNVVNAVADATPFTSTGIVNISDNAVLTVDSDASRSWLGYNIYKDGEMIEALWPDNFYTYLEHQIGAYCYTVTAEYSICGESDPSNEACVDIFVDINELTASDVSLYPNPAKDMVTVTSTMPISRLSVTNYVGQTVYSEVSTSTKVVLDTHSYLSGVYLVKIETENGVVTKRVIITK